MKRIVAVVACALLAAGCVNMKEVKPATGVFDAYKGQTLTVVTYEKPTFVANTAGGAMFGMLGAIANIEMGKELVEKNQIADPADAVAATISADITTQLGLTMAPPVKQWLTSNDAPEKLAKQGGSSGLVLDVETVGWLLNYYPFNWTHYRVMYSARARLIDVATGKVIAQVPCKSEGDEKDKAPSYEELTDHGAALLKEKMATASDVCIAQMKKGFSLQ